MSRSEDIARAHWAGATIAHCRYPPWEARETTQAAEPGSIAIGYNGQRNAVIQTAGDELRMADGAELGDLYGWEDQRSWAILSRLRAAVRDHLAVTDVERDHLVRRLCEHVATLPQPLRLGRVAPRCMASKCGSLQFLT
jgi:AraC family transcriptional regulator